MWERLSRLVLIAFRFLFEFRKSFFLLFLNCFLSIEVSVGATISLVLSDCRFWFEFQNPFLIYFVAVSLDYEYRIRAWSMEYERLLWYTVRTYQVYIVKKSTYPYSMLRICAPRRVPAANWSLWELLTLKVAHFRGIESRNICCFENYSSWRIEWRTVVEKDLRSSWKSATITTIVDGDAVMYAMP